MTMLLGRASGPAKWQWGYPSEQPEAASGKQVARPRSPWLLGPLSGQVFFLVLCGRLCLGRLWAPCGDLSASSFLSPLGHLGQAFTMGHLCSI